MNGSFYVVFQVKWHEVLQHTDSVLLVVSIVSLMHTSSGEKYQIKAAVSSVYCSGHLKITKDQLIADHMIL